MLKRLRQPVGMFQAPLLASLGMGTLICFAYYTMLLVMPSGPLALAKRYSECHAVAYVTVWMFFVSLSILTFKYLEATRQRRLLQQSTTTLDDIKIARSDEETPSEIEQIHWLEAAWKAQSVELFNSWLGKRIRAVLMQLQIRKSIDTLDQDQARYADRDANQQHDSYALVRIFAWAMPMLGFLGTVLGLSTTLGQMDASALATGSQDAMNQITSGLYVAFDTTAISLALTMAVIFYQYVVNKYELSLLDQIDLKSGELLTCCLVKSKDSQDLTNVEASLKAVTAGVLKSVEKLVKKQSDAWAQSLERAEARWAESTNLTRELLEKAMLPAVTEALQSISQPLIEHNERIAKIHADGAAMVDGRMQQWQVTISDQSRAVVEQQKELNHHTQLLSQLIEKADLVKAMETPLQATLQRMTDIDRFHDAAVCLTEAVAVLGTQMERYGYLGRQPLRRRADTLEPSVAPNSSATKNAANSMGKSASHSDNFDGSPEDVNPVSIPFTRKAG